jgi:hypothetical protein
MAIPLDQQIQTKMDAYRSNPRKLQQRYQQSQQLLDLLALQKLKSEKEAATRDMQMKMQMNPNTIKQQRERELLDMTKKELIDQTGGIMALNKARQQNNLKKAMSQGVTGRPAPNMMKLADGGIVGFQPGGGVLDRLIEEKIAEIQANPNLSSTEKQEAIAKLRAPKAQPKGIQKILGDRVIADQKYDDEVFDMGMGESKGDTIPLIPGSNPLNKFQRDTPIGKLAQRNIASLASQIGDVDMGGLPKDAMSIGTGGYPKKAPPEFVADYGYGILGTGEDKKTEEEPKVTAPELGIKGITAPTVKYKSVLDDIRDEVENLKKTDKTYEVKDVDEARKKGREDFKGETKDIIPALEKIQKEKQTGLESLIADKEAFYKREQDPDKLAREKLRAALIGAGGKATFGGVGKGIMQGVAGAEAKQQEFRVKGFNDVFGNKKSLIKEIGKDKADIIGKTFDITKAAFDVGEKRGKATAIENAAAKTAAAKLDSTVLSAISKDAEMFFKQDVTNADFKQKANIAHAKLMSAAADREVKVEIANLQADLGRQKNALLAEANKIKSLDSLRTFRTKLFTGTQKLILDLQAKYQKIYIPLANEAKALGGKDGQKRHDDLIKQMQAFIKSDTAALQAVTDGIIKDLEQNLGGGSGGSKKSDTQKKADAIINS